MKQIIAQLLSRLEGLSGSRTVKRMDIALAAIVTLVSLALYAYIETSGRNAAGLLFIQNIETRSLDARFTLRGTRPHDDDVVIVGLDENTLQRFGSYPIPRNAYAKMVNQLAADGAKVTAFDANFPVPEKNSAVEALRKLEQEIKGNAGVSVINKIREIEASSDDDAVFAEAIKRAGNVVLGHLFLDAERAKSVDAKGAEQYFEVLSAHVFPQVVPLNTKRDPFQIWQHTSQRNHEEQFLNAAGVFANLRILADGAKSFGFFNEQPDPDGTFRRSPLLIRYNHDDFDFLYPSLDVEAVRQFRNIPDDKTIAYFVQDGIDHVQLGPYNLKPDYDGTALINYAGPYKTYKHYSMFDVVSGNFAPGTFKGKLVIFGATAIAIGDLRTTPFHDDDYTGVEIHANVIDNILHSGEAGRGFITRGYKAEMVDVAFILAFGVGLGFFFSRTRPMVATAGAVAALFAFAWVTYFAFAHFGIWLSFVVPAGTLVANYATITSFRMIFEEREKRKVRKTFERYVSPGVISLIEKDPKKYFKTGGESKELTVMFSDIRDFTHLSEGLTPDELVRLLNEYLGDMTDILFRRWGTLDKYIGDALMGFWGSPFPQEDHAIRGCACALDMRLRLQELNAKWQAEGRKSLAIGIGLNTGVMNVGNMGSSKRFAWTVMGDNVNLASRLEGITKLYHVQCVVSEATYQSAKDHYVFREIDRITVKGKDHPVTIYELLDRSRNEANHTELIVRFSEALTAYRRQQWEDAIDLFNKILGMFPEDGPSRTFIERSRQYLEHPPAPEWDGVYAMTTK